MAPLAAKSLAALGQAVKAAGSEPPDVLRVSCFLSSLDEIAAVRKLVDQEYPAAAADFVQTQRAPPRSLAACEAVARLRASPSANVSMINPEGLPAEPGTSAIALVSSPKAVLTGTQVSFGFEEKDARLAFDSIVLAISTWGAIPTRRTSPTFPPSRRRGQMPTWMR